jgi:hypothetical protein
MVEWDRILALWYWFVTMKGEEQFRSRPIDFGLGQMQKRMIVWRSKLLIFQVQFRKMPLSVLHGSQYTLLRVLLGGACSNLHTRCSLKFHLLYPHSIDVAFAFTFSLLGCLYTVFLQKCLSNIRQLVGRVYLHLSIPNTTAPLTTIFIGDVGHCCPMLSICLLVAHRILSVILIQALYAK